MLQVLVILAHVPCVFLAFFVHFHLHACIWFGVFSLVIRLVCFTMPCHVMLRHITSHYHVMLYHAMPCHVMSCHVMSHHFTSSRHAMPCHAMSFYATLRHIISSCYAMPCHFMSCHVMPRHVTSRHVVSCSVMSIILDIYGSRIPEPVSQTSSFHIILPSTHFSHHSPATWSSWIRCCIG